MFSFNVSSVINITAPPNQECAGKRLELRFTAFPYCCDAFSSHVVQMLVLRLQNAILVILGYSALTCHWWLLTAVPCSVGERLELRFTCTNFSYYFGASKGRYVNNRIFSILLAEYMYFFSRTFSARERKVIPQ